MRFSKRRPALLFHAAAVAFAAAVVLGVQSSSASADDDPFSLSSGGFALDEPTWTTAHINEKGFHPFLTGKDTGLVVPYMAPSGWNPNRRGDWIGIYEKDQLDTAHRIDWDYVCPNEPTRCMSFGAAIIPAGNNGMVSGKVYTVAYWANGAKESNGRPMARVDYVVPW
ncbi:MULTISPECIES: hypothetical protein [Streptomyces]|jgi:hypothetical protein|uniref:Secreted protein n=1 Tax=Streptomyces nymphaeiformis TaxID=2663842 RepID=A0A7W7UB19_9ACTN|nr:hypothetical protein [Streptomyces nymphaeiformis]MBB4986940.1 hypothetical protein [Streptomyces nymphaeiformis]